MAPKKILFHLSGAVSQSTLCGLPVNQEPEPIEHDDTIMIPPSRHLSRTAAGTRFLGVESRIEFGKKKLIPAYNMLLCSVLLTDNPGMLAHVLGVPCYLAF